MTTQKCPECGSDLIIADGFHISKDVCPKCGYTKVFLGICEEEDEAGVFGFPGSNGEV